MLLVLALLACHREEPTDEPVDWPDVPAEPGRGVMDFGDRTDDWGLDLVNGAQLQAVDLDHDGFPDLVANDNSGIDDFSGGDRFHWVLMNRDDGAGGRTFVDGTVESGLFQRREGDGGRPSVNLSFADLDGDGDVDCFSGVNNDPHSDPAGHYTDSTDVLLNDGTGHFTFAPLSPDLQEDFPMTGLTLLDFDADGVLDAYLGLWYENRNISGWQNWIFGANDRLFRGNGDGTFDEVTNQVGIVLDDSASYDSVLSGEHARPAMGATACDLDGDAWTDVAVMSYGRQWNLQWMNRGGEFEEVARESGYAGDENADYSDNWYYLCWCWSNGECDAPDVEGFPYDQSQCGSVAAYWNDGWDDQPANLNGNTFSTACSDVDDDGDMDLWTGEITHEWAGGSSDLSGLLLNDGSGHFERPDLAEMGLQRTPVEDPSTTAWDFGDQKAAVADLDNDGRKDLLLPSGAAYYGNFLYVWRQWDRLQFSEVEADIDVEVPTAHGLALADFDRDGDLDMVVSSLSEVVDGTTSGHALTFYANQTDTYHWVRVALDSEDANSFGIGARVAVTADGKTQYQEVQASHAQHTMQHERVLTFGLGYAAEVDEIEVTWVGGATDTYEDLPADEQIVLRQGGDYAIDAP